MNMIESVRERGEICGRENGIEMLIKIGYVIGIEIDCENENEREKEIKGEIWIGKERD